MTNEDFKKLEGKFHEIVDKYYELCATWRRFSLSKLQARVSLQGFEVKPITISKLNDDLEELAQAALDASDLIELDPLFSDKAPIAVTSSDIEQSEIKLINATAHKITLLTPESTPEKYEVVQEIEPSGLVLRRREKSVDLGTIKGLPRVKKEFLEIEGLPPPEDGVFYIVSAICLDPNRNDLLVPLTIRGSDRSQILGCIGFGC